MLRKALGFLLLLIIACAVATCSTNPKGTAQNPTSSSTTIDTEQPLISQNSSEADTSDKLKNSENGETKEIADDTPAEDPSKCPIELTADQYPEVKCAKLYQITGRVRYTNNQDGTGLEDISKLAAYKRSGWGKQPEALLSGLYNKVETKKPGNRLLFNTLDMFLMGENAELVFEKGRALDRSKQRKIENKGTITLNLGEIVVSSAEMLGQSPVSAANSDEPSSLVSKNQDSRVKSSLFQRLLYGGRARLNRLRTSLLPNGFIAQPVLANDVDTSLLNNPTLRVETPEAKIDSNGAVYVVRRDASRARTQIYSLTEQPIKVTDNINKDNIFINRNQTVVVNQDGILEKPYEFRLCGFYRDNKNLLEGLAPRDVGVVRQQPRDMQFAYHGARSLTVPLYHKNCQRRCAPRGS